MELKKSSDYILTEFNINHVQILQPWLNQILTISVAILLVWSVPREPIYMSTGKEGALKTRHATSRRWIKSNIHTHIGRPYLYSNRCRERMMTRLRCTQISIFTCAPSKVNFWSQDLTLVLFGEQASLLKHKHNRQKLKKNKHKKIRLINQFQLSEWQNAKQMAHPRNNLLQKGYFMMLDKEKGEMPFFVLLLLYLLVSVWSPERCYPQVIGISEIVISDLIVFL